ncbi:TetR/AcrR family transcriptional regulator [Cereibacter sp. SYSU M97828]|nr:TetR/AcrR family transcriptional regulator [Cereibacter flavus]
MSQREEQKTRTRRSLVEAARRLLGRGEPLTIASAARECGISKASAYRYYSDPALLAAEAGLEVKMAPYEEIVAGADTTRDRLVAICLYNFDLAIANEAAFRAYLSLNLQAPPSDIPRRGARRIAAFLRALDAEGLPPEQARRIAAALGTATGIEAMIALVDVAGCPAPKARGIVREMAEAICERMLR